MPAEIYIIGKKFGRLTVIGNAPTRYSPCGAGQKCSLCQCDCGKVVTVRNIALRRQTTLSCGCLNKELVAMRHFVHGQCPKSGSSGVYNSWESMIRRCYNKSRHDYQNYGGRGITVCDRWKVFSNFFADMGDRPEGMTLDRIDNSLGYHPGNVRWATRLQQIRNRRVNRVFTIRGITACLSELCEKFGISYGVVLSRMREGWEVERAITTPVKPYNRHKL